MFKMAYMELQMINIYLFYMQFFFFFFIQQNVMLKFFTFKK